MNQGRVIRTAEERDLDTVVELRAEMFRAMGVPDEASEWRRNAREWFGLVCAVMDGPRSMR